MSEASEKASVRIIQKGQVRFVSPTGRLLADVAANIAACLPDDFPKAGTVYIGAHMLHPIDEAGSAVAIQTEQHYDADGRELWRLPRRMHLKRMVERFPVILDLSDSNRRSYEFLEPELKAKVHFGPWVFPAEPQSYVPGTAPIVFFGSRDERRDAVLREVATRTDIEILPRGTFGAALRERVLAARAVLNIHFEEGIYAEIPRILSALQAGKPIVSEPLPAPFVAGEHYVPHDRLDGADLAAIFANMDRLAQSYRLADFLMKVL